jgi:hypothetical protein
LVATKEKPEIFLPKLLSKDHHNIIVYQQEISEEKVKIEANLAEQLELIKSKGELSV